MAINANKHELARKAWRDEVAKNAEVGSKMATNRERERGMDGREERRHYEARGKKANQTGRDDSGDALIALNGPQRFPMRARERERERERARRLSFSSRCWHTLSKCL